MVVRSRGLKGQVISGSLVLSKNCCVRDVRGIWIGLGLWKRSCHTRVLGVQGEKYHGRVSMRQVRKHVHRPSTKSQASQACMMKRESRHLTVPFSLRLRWVTPVKLVRWVTAVKFVRWVTAVTRLLPTGCPARHMQTMWHTATRGAAVGCRRY